MAKKRKYTESVSVLFTPETLQQLNEITDQMEISNSEFIREIVLDALNQGLEEDQNHER